MENRREMLKSTMEDIECAMNRGFVATDLSLAEKVLRLDPVVWRAKMNAGCVFVDAGTDLRRRDLLNKGLDLLREAHETCPNEFKGQISYAIGNAYLSIGQGARGQGPATRRSIAQSVSWFDEGLSLLPEQTECMVNLGNALSAQGRSVEALTLYTHALSITPERHEAFANRAIALRSISEHIFPQHIGLKSSAANDIARALELVPTDSAFTHHYATVQSSLDQYSSIPVRQIPIDNPSALWIWENDLNLNPCPHCKAECPDAFDTFALSGRLRTPPRHLGKETVAEMFNALHRSFSTARWILLQGLGVAGKLPDDHVSGMATTSEAKYGLNSGLLLNSTSSFYGILNQIASCLNAYFNLQHPLEQVSLSRVWAPVGSRSRRIPERVRDLHPRFQRERSLMLNALYSLSHSLECGKGRYWPLRKIRNQIEHHTILVGDSLELPLTIKSIGRGQLLKSALEIGRVARAAILYFGGAVLASERRRMRELTARGFQITSREKEWVSRQ